jgi:DNA-binding NarL/FixJ family response regulator
MKNKIKNLWIKALRSGEFKQCRGYLAKDGKYCALGVLSVLALIEGECTYNEEDGVGKFDNRRFRLSYNVMKWAGIAQQDERFLDSKEHEVLIMMNNKKTSVLELNDCGKSFKEIARIIEIYYK